MSHLAPPAWLEERTRRFEVELVRREIVGTVATVTSWDVLERNQEPMPTGFDSSHLALLTIITDDRQRELVAVSDGWYVPAGARVKLRATGRQVRRPRDAWAECCDEATLVVNDLPRKLAP